MPRVLLINPNTSAATTRMMVDIAAARMPAGFVVEGIESLSGVPMIVDETEMAQAASEVPRSWQRAGPGWDGVIVSAFGDPGIEAVRASTRVPVVGICEASLSEAGEGGRRFGVATVTPALAGLIARQVAALGLAGHYAGIRLTPGAPRALAADPDALVEALARAVAQSIAEDGAEAVVIGGGPLGRAAASLQGRFPVPLVAPIDAAVRQLLALLAVR